MNAEQRNGIDKFPEYLWWTGVKKILDSRFTIDGGDELRERMRGLQCNSADKRREDQSTAVLFLRDGGANMWHSLMEIYSYYQSMDTLAMAVDKHGQPYFDRQKDTNDYQVIWVDDKGPGPYHKVWNMFSSKPAVHLEEIDTSRTCFDRVIIPLPGGANTMWEGDWRIHTCKNSTMLDVFQRRVLDYFRIPEPDKFHPFTVSFIDRKQTRSLHNQALYLEKLRAKYPRITFKTFDLQEVDLEEQLRIVRETNVLVGTHGAGLTSTWFLPPRSSVVEILPPDFLHKGFRNLAHIMGHRFFSAHGTKHEGEGEGWRNPPLFVEEDRFMRLMDMAIGSQWNSGVRNEDAV